MHSISISISTPSQHILVTAFQDMCNNKFMTIKMHGEFLFLFSDSLLAFFRCFGDNLTITY